ncbi:MAG: VWA domain-containing protein [Candidatus Binataceae bacterium]|nr:VWA domain-containing protein [Candidatus Binataceae bacterium]
MQLPPRLAPYLGQYQPVIENLQFAHPAAFHLLWIVAIVFVWSLFWSRSIGRIGGPLLRALMLTLFVIALADPQTVTHSAGHTRPVMVDMSASMTAAMRGWSAGLLHNGFKLAPGDPAWVFGTRPAPANAGEVVTALARGTACAGCGPEATNLEIALNRLAADPAVHNARVALITDGWENRGDATRAASALNAAHVRLEIFTPPGTGKVPDVAMTELSLPPAMAKAAPFALGVTMTNLGAAPVPGVLSVYENGKLSQDRAVTIAAGQDRFDFSMAPQESGLVAYKAIFKPNNPALDRYPENDFEQGFIGIGARHKVLILSDSARDANYIEAVVRRMGLEPEPVVLASGQYSNSNFKDYEAVLLNNVARARLSPAVQEALVRYVSGGGSLAMVGGDQSFGLGGYQNSPIAAAMPVIMKPPQHRQKQRALVLIIDKSGSMGRNNKLEYAKAAARTVLKTMSDSDLIAVIGFDSQPFVVVPLEPLGKARPYFDPMIDRLRAQGTTYLLPAMEQAQRMLAGTGASTKHVVILTDGETGGSAVMYYDLVSSMHHDGGITISTIAVGNEANVQLLQAISRYGGGGFYQTDSPSSLPRIFLTDVKQHGGEVTMVEKQFVPHSVNPDPILKELAARQLPPVLGFVSTQLKPRATLSMYADRQGNREPLIASWRYGAGKAMAITTDASGRWSGSWVRNDLFAPLWDRLLAWMTPPVVPATEQQFAAALGYDSGRIKLRLVDYSSAPGHRTPDMMTAIVTRPDGSKTQALLTQNVPGELSGSIDAAHPGTYYIGLKSIGAKQPALPPLAYAVSPAVNAEIPRPQPNYALLETLAAATGGHLNPMPSEVDMSRPTFEHRVSLSEYFILAAMLLLIMEALVRRLTW